MTSSFDLVALSLISLTFVQGQHSPCGGRGETTMAVRSKQERAGVRAADTDLRPPGGTGRLSSTRAFAPEIGSFRIVPDVPPAAVRQVLEDLR